MAVSHPAPKGRGSSPLALRMSAGRRSGSAASSPLTLTLTREAPGDPGSGRAFSVLEMFCSSEVITVVK